MDQRATDDVRRPMIFNTDQFKNVKHRENEESDDERFERDDRKRARHVLQ
tara:strand:+ start:274 stop:423 length:150 start_codon:yes stop_codon:yes gene_type:complete